MSRVTNYTEAKNVFENSRKRKLANNTYLLKIGNVPNDHYGIKLHDTIIIKFLPDRTILDSGGYKTMTTKTRINEFTDFNVWQDKGIWYIGNNYKDSNPIIFNDNCYYKNSKWYNVGKDPKPILKLRKKIQIYAKEYTKNLMAGNIQAPDNGDCFYCHLVDVKTNKPIPDNSHILSHIAEKYYVPSLLVNAISEFPVSNAAKSVISHFWNNTKQCEFFVDTASRQIESSIKRYCYRQLNTAS